MAHDNFDQIKWEKNVIFLKKLTEKVKEITTMKELLKSPSSSTPIMSPSPTLIPKRGTKRRLSCQAEIRSSPVENTKKSTGSQTSVDFNSEQTTLINTENSKIDVENNLKTLKKLYKQKQQQFEESQKLLVLAIDDNAELKLKLEKRDRELEVKNDKKLRGHIFS